MKKKQQIKVRMAHVNKKLLARKKIWFKKTRLRMNYEWIEKTIEKKFRSKNRKCCKTRS